MSPQEEIEAIFRAAKLLLEVGVGLEGFDGNDDDGYESFPIETPEGALRYATQSDEYRARHAAKIEKYIADVLKNEEAR